MSAFSLASVLPRRPQFQMALLVGTIVLLPALLASFVLWTVLSQQLFSSYEKRLAASLETFGLIIENKNRNLWGALSRIAADNTIQVTLDLDIRPQLRRYLHSQYEVAGLDFLHVLSKGKESLAMVGHTVDEAVLSAKICIQSQDGPSETIAQIDDRLFLIRSIPVQNNSGILGHLCGGLAINDEALISYIRTELGGVPLYHWQDSILKPHDIDGPSLGLKPPGQMFDYKSTHGRYKGMFTTIDIEGVGLAIGFLVTLKELDEGIAKAVGSIAFVLLVLTAVALFALRARSLRKQAETLLHQEKERAVVTLASIADGVVTTDHLGRIAYLNAAAEGFLCQSREQVVGRPWRDMLNIYEEETGRKISNPLPGNSSAESTFHAANNLVLEKHDGERVAIQFSTAPIGNIDDQSSGIVLVIRDVGQERELQQRLAWRASRDDLTGLFNRTEFRNRVADAITDTRLRDITHSLMYLDLDEFKIINDTCGHHTGDELLKQIGTTLLSQTRVSDTVARLGGDEFGILLPGCALERAEQVANKILDALNDHRFSCRNRVFDVGASIGLVAIDAVNQDLDDLMASVDSACYAAKAQGRNRVNIGCLDTEQITQRLDELRLVSMIREALKEGRFILYHQPIASVEDTSDASYSHSEILVRMLDENGKMIPPGAFIPVAERHGLMPQIDRWVIDRVFYWQGHHDRTVANRQKQKKNPRRNAPGPRVFTINISGASIVDSEFLTFVKDKLREHDVPESTVFFEITETAAITHLDKARHFMTELRKYGCRFLLDDFGSGMSSFGYLKNLPVDYLKIDGLFVKDMINDPIDRSMVKAINDIGHVMKLKTVAEFVENDEIFEELRKIGVDMAQGYGVALPRPLEPERNRGEVLSLNAGCA